MMKTRRKTKNELVTEEARPAEQMQGILRTGYRSTGHQPWTNNNNNQLQLQLQQQTSWTLSALSQEGKLIVSTIVKALSFVSQGKDKVKTKLQDRVDLLEARVTKL